jgi:hypothetical protein
MRNGRRQLDDTEAIMGIDTGVAACIEYDDEYEQSLDSWTLGEIERDTELGYSCETQAHLDDRYA